MKFHKDVDPIMLCAQISPTTSWGFFYLRSVQTKADNSDKNLKYGFPLPLK